MAEAIPLVEQSGAIECSPTRAGPTWRRRHSRDRRRPCGTTAGEEAQRGGGGAAGLANLAASIGTFGRTSVNSIFSRPFSRVWVKR